MSDLAYAKRVLILAPVGRDAELMETHLAKAGITSVVCRDMDAVSDVLLAGAGALLFTEEALSGPASRR